MKTCKSCKNENCTEHPSWNGGRCTEDANECDQFTPGKARRFAGAVKGALKGKT